MPQRTQVGQRRAHSHAAQVVGWRHTDAPWVGPVGVLGCAVPLLLQRFTERPLDGRNRFRLAPPHRHRAVRSVEVVLNVQVLLHLAVEGKHLVERPLRVAHCSPVVEVLRQSPLHRLPVYRRPPADNLPLGDVNLPLFWSYGSPQRPVVFRFRGFREPGAAELDLVGQVVRAVVPAGLQHQHRGIHILHQPSGQRGTRRASAHDDHVVIHGTPFYFHFPVQLSGLTGCRGPHYTQETALAPCRLLPFVCLGEISLPYSGVWGSIPRPYPASPRGGASKRMPEHHKWHHNLAP